MASLAEILMGTASPGQPYGSLAEMLTQDAPQAYESYLAPYTPSPLDRVRQGLLSIGAPQQTAQGAANLLDWLPGVGDAEGMYQAGREGAAGNIGTAGIIGGLTLAGVPAGKATRAAKGITAYHGTPHDFDRFELSPRTIGTGEGAQAYGHGLYFAGDEAVAKGYRDNVFAKPDSAFFSSPSARDIAETQLQSFGAQPGALALAADDLRKALQNAEFKARIFPGDDASARVADLKEAISYLDTRVQPGHMYEVNIDADPASLLDWDAPLSAQSKNVQDLFGPRLEQFRGLGAQFGKDPSGAELHRAAHPTVQIDDVDWSRGMADQATDRLRDAGIPGIKFLDGQSRNAGAGSHNYVIFDDKLIEILRKYGLAGATVGTGAAAANALQPQNPESY